MAEKQTQGAAGVVSLAAWRAARCPSHAAMWREVQGFRAPLSRGEGAALRAALSQARAFWDMQNEAEEDDETGGGALAACNALTAMLHAAPVRCLAGAAVKAELIAWEMGHGFEPELDWIEDLRDGLRRLASGSGPDQGAA